VGSLERAALVAALAAATPALACELPEEGAPRLRATVAAVKYQPQTEAWEKSLPAGTAAQYIVHLDESRTINDKCYWILEVRAGNETWKRFFVMPGGGNAFEEVPRESPK
jgi:hypothetical protein